MDKILLEFTKELKAHNDNFDLLDDMYRYAKEISLNYYDGQKMSDEFKSVILDLRRAEYSMQESDLCDVSINYKNKDYLKNKIVNKFTFLLSDSEDLLDYIVYSVRQRLVGDENFKRIDFFDLVNFCEQSSRFVKILCRYTLNIPCKTIRIDPGFEEYLNLFGGGRYHYFSIVSILGKKYIVDCTYKQFFKKRDNSLEKIGVPEIATPYVGIFMMIDGKRKKLAETLLKRGWVEATNENLKMYLDAFTISFRNGLYYEQFDTVKYETDYDAKDYYNFLENKDYQLNHESRKFLGYQKRPLNNPKLKFKI